MKNNSSIIANICLPSLFFLLLFGCSQANQTVSQENIENKVFSYNETEIPDAKPWSSENFQNKPENFQFVINGDRTG